jgi:hypothetical protein
MTDLTYSDLNSAKFARLTDGAPTPWDLIGMFSEDGVYLEALRAPEEKWLTMEWLNWVVEPYGRDVTMMYVHWLDPRIKQQPRAVYFLPGQKIPNEIFQTGAFVTLENFEDIFVPWQKHGEFEILPEAH